ncbi:RNA recognition motif domain-containing protein [Chitinophaga varians]|uniref:RNA recognition motif domain-containing protein n=1 Tax=Chitinophaga varians TaxID=2202339 RepID=UPI00165FB932|nr:RNA-binding protein [Chitinophaga varians]MBC9909604.1 RNA-binding protein [Chitinophaga varians]
MNIYVSNLGYNFQIEDLVNLFIEYGVISSARIVEDKFTNKSKGFGFVEMENRIEAENAIRALNGMEIGGRVISVTEAPPQKPRSGYQNRYR